MPGKKKMDDMAAFLWIREQLDLMAKTAPDMRRKAGLILAKAKRSGLPIPIRRTKVRGPIDGMPVELPLARGRHLIVQASVDEKNPTMTFSLPQTKVKRRKK